MFKKGQKGVDYGVEGIKPGGRPKKTWSEVAEMTV